MQRLLFLNACLVVALSVASGCADVTWLRKKPALPEALLASPSENPISPYQSKVGDKSSAAETIRASTAASAPSTIKTVAAPTAHARESFATTIEHVSTSPPVTAQDYAELRRAIEQPATGLPPIFQQQCLALLEVLESQSSAAHAGDPVLLQPATAVASSPTPPPRDAASAAPHVTVNVHAGGAAAEAAPEVVATVARLEPKPDNSELKSPTRETKSPPSDAVASPTDENTRRLPAAESPAAAKLASVEPSFRAGAWRERVQHTIDALDFELRRDADELNSDERARLVTYQRLLNVVADKHDAAVAPLDSPDKSQQQFWQHQLHALVVALDESGTPVLTRRAALALRELREAASHLAALSALDLRNLAFCTQVDGFGTFASFAKNEFKPDQEVLLYVEVDNFTVEEKSAGRRGELFETELRGSYQIFDPTGRRVADVELPLDKQACRSRRRDYFIAYPIYLPKKIEAGSYTLQLTIEDAKASKFGQGSIEFKIKP